MIPNSLFFVTISIKVTYLAEKIPFKIGIQVIIKKIRNNKCWRDCKEKEPLCAVGMNINWCNHLDNSIEISLKN